MSQENKQSQQADSGGAGAAGPGSESKAAPAPDSRKQQPKRFTAKRKLEAVQRLVAGESLEAVSRDIGVTVAQLSKWRDQALAGAESSLKTRDRDDEIARLHGKLGEVTMENELLQEKVRRLEAKDPLVGRRSRN